METRLWRVIEKLRGGIDVRDYKDIILPLVFLRSADIEFSKRLAEISKMKHFSGEILPEFFVSFGGVFLPEDARWEYLAKCAKEKVSNLSARVDRAFRVISETNPEMDGLFSDGFYVKKISSEKLASVILEIDKVEKPDLNAAYMYLLRKFSAKESRGKGKGEFYTPASVWEFIQEEIGSNISGKIYDPCIGMGGMVLPILNSKRSEVEIFGQEINPETLKFAKLNFLMQGYKANLASGDTLSNDAFPGLLADLVFCNPPFNLKTKKLKNANYAWVELCVAKMAKNGVAVVILPGTALVDKKFVEERRKLVRENVSAVVNLPMDAFAGVSTPISILILKKKVSGEIRFLDKRGSYHIGVNIPRAVVLENENASLALSDYFASDIRLRPESFDFSREISLQIREKEREISRLRGMLDFSIDWSGLSGVALSEIVEEVPSVDSILPGEFAVNLLHVGRDVKLPVVLNSGDEAMAVPKSYFKFRVRESWASRLPAEYLLMLLLRPETAEGLAFLSDKSAWGEVSVEEFLGVKF